MSGTRLRIATRVSNLAQWQARHVAGLLETVEPSLAVELVDVTTAGDKDRTRPLDRVGGVGVFTREIQQAVLEGRADLAVHSLKDLPTEPVDGLVLAGVPSRGEIADALLLPAGETLTNGIDGLDREARVGTGSPRRQAQLRFVRPDLELVGIRGNVETRLNKLDAGEYDAVVLAVAGLIRLGLEDRISARLDGKTMLPAVGQGALGLECRDDDAVTAALLTEITHEPTRQAVSAERALMARLQAGCHAPVGVRTERIDTELQMNAVVLDPEGCQRIEAHGAARATDAISLGREVAETLLSQGADVLIG